MENGSTEAETRAWDRWLNDRDEAARTWLIGHYAPMVEQGVRTFRNVRRQDVDDLRGAGYVGLIESVDKWNPDKMPWLEFARFRIRAAMVDHIRGVSWVGKATRQSVKRLEQAEAELTARLNGQPPTDEELAAHLGLDTDGLADLRSKLQGTGWGVASLDMSLQEGEGSWVDVLPDPRASVEDEADRRDRAAMLRSILDRLPARMRDILTRCFLEGESQKSVAKRYQLHESRISQVLSEGLAEARRLAHERPLEACR